MGGGAPGMCACFTIGPLIFAHVVPDAKSFFSGCGT
jgi:hypothetical protein